MREDSLTQLESGGGKAGKLGQNTQLGIATFWNRHAGRLVQNWIGRVCRAPTPPLPRPVQRILKKYTILAAGSAGATFYL